MSIIPKTKDNYLGIEIEAISPYSITEIKNLIKGLNLQNYVDVTGDSSIETDNCNCYLDDNYDGCHQCNEINYGIEFCILVKESELTKFMHNFSIVLQMTECYVNESCGLHVHLDCRNRDLVGSFLNLFLKQSEMVLSIDEERIDSSYCDVMQTPLKPEQIESFIYRSNMSRYYGINIAAFNKYKTIEIRFHEGTVNTDSIINWCRYLIGVIDNKPSNEGQNYVKNRISQKFNKSA